MFWVKLKFGAIPQTYKVFENLIGLIAKYLVLNFT